MAASSRRQSPVKRLLTELSSYQNDPNPALERLGPVNDDDLFTWTAILLGVQNTPYEGI
jgi:peroxin-4